MGQSICADASPTSLSTSAVSALGLHVRSHLQSWCFGSDFAGMLMMQTGGELLRRYGISRRHRLAPSN
jgi:hypothetical protein